jgi:hypothetical protein
MIKLKIDEEEYILADTWEEVTFGQYIDILVINDNKFNDLIKSIKIIAALSDNPASLEKALNKVTLDELSELTAIIGWISSDFTEVANKSEKSDKFLIDGKEYVIKKNYNKLTIGEMASLEELMKTGLYNNQELAIAILLREVVNGVEKEFNDEDFYYVLTDLKNKIKIVEVYNYIMAFLNGEKTSTIKVTKSFSVVKV